MSSMRNAVHRRQHRERPQLQGREKWGILEKHKDYSLRARDYNAKKAQLARLDEKARDRNPDEFAFGMMSANARTQGKHGAALARDSAAARGLSHEAIKLLKTQDAGYLRTVGERVRRELERVESDVKMQEGMSNSLGENKDKKKGKGRKDAGDMDDDEFEGFDFDLDDIDDDDDDEDDARPNKVVFAEDRAEQLLRKRRLQNTDSMDTTEEPSDDDQKPNPKQKKTPKQLAAERQALVDSRRARKIRKRAIEARENKLKALRKQFEDITAAERELEWQRARMDNVVGGTNKNGVKWKIRERKR